MGYAFLQIIGFVVLFGPFLALLACFIYNWLSNQQQTPNPKTVAIKSKTSLDNEKENECYTAIDNMWSWTKDDNLYRRFKSFETKMRNFIKNHISVCSTVAPSEQDLFLTFVMLHSFAYSYYLVMQLENDIACDDVDRATHKLIEVISERGYIGENADIDTIDTMVSDKNLIVAETLRKLRDESGDFLSIYTSYFLQITEQDVTRQCKNNKPLTAALLYVITDFLLMTHENRIEITKEIIDFLENEVLEPSELNVFDAAVEIYGAIIRGELSPRGDWRLKKDAKQTWIMNVFICYGDLMKNTECISNYRSAPVLIESAEKQYLFFHEFMSLSADVVGFTQRIMDNLK